MTETEEQPGYAERDDEPTTDPSGTGNIDESEAGDAAPDQDADSADESGS